MKPDKEIFLPDTTLKFSTLRQKLKENYNLEVIDEKTKYTYIGITFILSTILLLKILKK
jgi:hypothetical protein